MEKIANYNKMSYREKVVAVLSDTEGKTVREAFEELEAAQSYAAYNDLWIAIHELEEEGRVFGSIRMVDGRRIYRNGR
jgi:predicted Zn-ribbon and HTH transcriptional regulator